MKKFAVVLSGCGVYDGAEIHEAVLTLYSIKKNGAEYEIFAPDQNQYHVINHLNGQESSEIRNVLVESARIARGEIKPLSSFNALEFDGIIFPGGFGAAKNLSDFAFNAENCTIHSDVQMAIKNMFALKKPIGALCIAPHLLAALIPNAEVTIGSEVSPAESITKMGGKHKITTHGEIVVDIKNKLVTSPCYMLNADILQIADGANNTIIGMLNLM